MDEKPKALATETPPLDLSGAIEGILAQLISMVASALGKAPPTTQEPSAAESEVSPLSAIAESAPSGAFSPEAISTLAPLISGLSGIKKSAPSAKHDDPRICLLLALKPYLSASRCEAIDTMIRLSTISEVLRGLPNGGGKGGQ